MTDREEPTAKAAPASAPPPDDAGLRRREVLAIGAAAGAGIVASCLPVVRYLSPNATLGGSNAAEVPADRLAPWEAIPLVVAARPAYLLRTASEYVAVGSRCTHLACIVKWQRSRRNFFCPCHGARFAPDGSVLSGPAPTPLPRLRVTETAGVIRVELA